MHSLQFLVPAIFILEIMEALWDNVHLHMLSHTCKELIFCLAILTFGMRPHVPCEVQNIKQIEVIVQ